MDKLQLRIKGHIVITSNKEGVLYNNSNLITADALEVITNCLYQADYTKQIDTMVAMGDFGEIARQIISSHYDHSSNTISFKAVFYETDFTGTIERVELVAGSFFNKVFAEKAALAIYKDAESRVQIEWRIQIAIS